MNLKALKDKNGKAFGQEMYNVAEESKIKEVTYVWPKPGSAEPVDKGSYYVTKVGDQIRCGLLQAIGRSLRITWWHSRSRLAYATFMRPAPRSSHR
ncbi:MAG: cache domain-containing protein [Gammaproteobacteria bacterium]